MSDFDVLLPLRTGGGRAPLFCVHSGFALGWTYAGLLRYLGPDQPLYALQARGVGTGVGLPTSYAEMVDDYLEQILAVRPHGPYRLLGWSLGGMIAHSLATRLQARGETVELLALLDTIMLGAAELRVPPGDLAALIERETAAVRAAVPDPDNLTRVVANLIRLRDGFVPTVFKGDVLLFTAALEPGRTESVRDPWLPWVDGTIHEYPVASDHMGMLNARNAREIGRRLAQTLAGPGRGAGDESKVRT